MRAGQVLAHVAELDDVESIVEFQREMMRFPGKDFRRHVFCLRQLHRASDAARAALAAPDVLARVPWARLGPGDEMSFGLARPITGYGYVVRRVVGDRGVLLGVPRAVTGPPCGVCCGCRMA